MIDVIINSRTYSTHPSSGPPLVRARRSHTEEHIPSPAALRFPPPASRHSHRHVDPLKHNLSAWPQRVMKVMRSMCRSWVCQQEDHKYPTGSLKSQAINRSASRCSHRNLDRVHSIPPIMAVGPRKREILLATLDGLAELHRKTSPRAFKVRAHCSKLELPDRLSTARSRCSRRRKPAPSQGRHPPCRQGDQGAGNCRPHSAFPSSMSLKSSG
mmetsp:Transcript_27404/g.91078  ORF Transcript_27404/g.91078 Transcript_27404/m.91078 type:complete len:213 (-) Transcript_27404:325-963(-)